MQAIVQDRFGPPDILQLADTDLPEVGADDVLVRVHAAALNPADWHIVRGDHGAAHEHPAHLRLAAAGRRRRGPAPLARCSSLTPRRRS